MGLIAWFKNKFKSFSSDEEDETSYDDTIREDTAPIRRDSINIRVQSQRNRYIENCCEQMIEADKEIERSKMEYRLVSGYLTDTEVIDALPDDAKLRLRKIAERIISLNKQSRAGESTLNLGRISEERFKTFLKYENEIPDDVKNMKKNEDFKELIREDMQKLEGEKAVSEFKIRELKGVMNNMKSWVLITFVFGIALIGLLSFLQFKLLMHAEIGFLLTAFIGAGAFIFEYLTYSRAKAGLKKTERYLNAVIAELNKVKIRFVNTSNLLEYEYRKYSVNASDELSFQWDVYIEEKQARQAVERANNELSFERTALLKELRAARIKDPTVWLNRCEALIDPGEMVEVRHELFERRGNIRKRIEYNTEARDISRDEINSIVHDYPEYGQEILSIVSKFDPA